MDKKEILNKYFNQFNLPIDEKISNNFLSYYELLIEWNNKFNLTSITDFEEVVVKHFIDSVISASKLKKNSSVLDVGAGAGFPSLPLKIYRDDLDVVMLDSLNKRVSFLTEVVSSLALRDVCAVHSRAEDYAKEKRESFDYCVARAVARLSTLCEYCLPFVKVGGYFVAYKSNDEDELNEAKSAITQLGGQVESVFSYDLSNFAENRCIILIKKIRNTPMKYPRNKNLPRVKPL